MPNRPLRRGGRGGFEGGVRGPVPNIPLTRVVCWNMLLVMAAASLHEFGSPLEDWECSCTHVQPCPSVPCILWLTKQKPQIYQRFFSLPKLKIDQGNPQNQGKERQGTHSLQNDIFAVGPVCCLLSFAETTVTTFFGGGEDPKDPAVLRILRRISLLSP